MGIEPISRLSREEDFQIGNRIDLWYPPTASDREARSFYNFSFSFHESTNL
jgi:hypothetical protein